MNVFAGENIAPQHASQGSAERKAKRAVVYANGHAVDGAPKGAVRDGDVRLLEVDLLPGLDDAGEEDGGADVCAGELGGGQVSWEE